jgi:hypothetical protein
METIRRPAEANSQHPLWHKSRPILNLNQMIVVENLKTYRSSTGTYANNEKNVPFPYSPETPYALKRIRGF